MGINGEAVATVGSTRNDDLRNKIIWNNDITHVSCQRTLEIFSKFAVAMLRVRERVAKCKDSMKQAVASINRTVNWTWSFNNDIKNVKDLTPVLTNKRDRNTKLN